jgi:intracellular multiplication protein IcmE
MFWNPFVMILKDARRRNVILLTFAIVLVIMVMGVTRFLHHMQPKAPSQLETVENVRSIPGGVECPPSQEYVKLQKQHNREQAKRAQKTGKSAIATIVDSFQAQAGEAQSPEATPSSGAQSNEQTTLQEPSPFLAPPPEAYPMLSSQSRLSAQKAELMKQHVQSAMTQQMGNLFNRWNAPAGQESVASIEEKGQSSEHKGLEKEPEGTTPMIKAGTIFHAVLLTAINSDEPGPVLAKIVSGELKGARLMGTLSNLGERVGIRFETLNMPNMSHTLSIKAVAVDESTARTALSSYTDRHIMVRYGSLLASSFVEGYGFALQHSGERISGYYAHPYHPDQNIPVSNTIWSRMAPKLDPTDKVFVALGNVGSHFSRVLGAQFNQRPTVHVHAGTGIGILLMADLAGLSSDE